jgi:hypothetical protein
VRHAGEQPHGIGEVRGLGLVEVEDHGNEAALAEFRATLDDG